MSENKLTPTTVNDINDREKIGDAEKRMGIADMQYILMEDGTTYYIRRNPGEMRWSIYSDMRRAPVGFLAATYSDTRAMSLQVWDDTGNTFAYGDRGNHVMLNKGLARLHDYLRETGRA